MTILTFSLILFIVGIAAGLLGALTGLGGGILIIPVLALVFKVDIHLAMGASLLCVIATSSGTAMAYLKEYANLRVGIFLETAAVIGALVGAILVSYIPTHILAIMFGLVLLLSATFSLHEEEIETTPKQISHPLATTLQLGGKYPTSHGYQVYSVQRVPLAWAMMLLAGALSGLLGIGSGVLKVISMDLAMRLPYKVSTTTSNFMIGITAAVGVGIYFSKGYVDPTITFPVMLGVVLGSFCGATLLARMQVKLLRIIFTIIVLLLAFEMIAEGLTGKI